MATGFHGDRTKSRSLCERLLPWTLTPHQLNPTRYRDLVPAWPFPSFLPEPSSDAVVACNPPSHARWAIRQLYPTSRPRESLPTLLSSDAHSPMAATASRPYECRSSHSSRTPERSNPGWPRLDRAPSLPTPFSPPPGPSSGPAQLQLALSFSLSARLPHSLPSLPARSPTARATTVPVHPVNRQASTQRLRPSGNRTTPASSLAPLRHAIPWRLPQPLPRTFLCPPGTTTHRRSADTRSFPFPPASSLPLFHADHHSPPPYKVTLYTTPSSLTRSQDHRQGRYHQHPAILPPSHHPTLTRTLRTYIPACVR